MPKLLSEFFRFVSEPSDVKSFGVSGWKWLVKDSICFSQGECRYFHFPRHTAGHFCIRPLWEPSLGTMSRRSFHDLSEEEVFRRCRERQR